MPEAFANFSGMTLYSGMLNPDEMEPPRPVLKPMDFQPMSVGELKEYIQALKAEIKRAENMIAKKDAHKSGVEALFGKPK